MSPGRAPEARPGSTTVMNDDDNTPERAVALVNQALDLLRSGEDAPASPVNSFLPAKRRRALRRDAARLRQGKAEPRYKNLFTAEELAAIYERTVIDAKSRTLVETTGTAVVGTMREEPLTLFVVGHDGISLEAFGTTGRLWKTGTISSGGFRRLAITDVFQTM